MGHWVGSWEGILTLKKTKTLKTNKQKTITRASVQKDKIYEPKLEIEELTLTEE